MKIEYHTHHWGPLLFKTKITVEDLKKVKALCKKDKKKEDKNTQIININHPRSDLKNAKYNELIKNSIFKEPSIKTL